MHDNVWKCIYIRYRYNNKNLIEKKKKKILLFKF